MTSSSAATPALGVLYYHGDHLGSTTVVTDEVGTLVVRSVYGVESVAGPFILVPASELASNRSNWRRDEARAFH